MGFKVARKSFGLNVSHQRSDIIRAIYEGTAYALKDAFSVFGEIAQGFQEYIFVGGGVKIIYGFQ